MALYHGCNANGEPMSSVYVEKDDSDPRFGLDCSHLPSLTRQEFKDECDVNVIMDRFAKTGEQPAFLGGAGNYMDVAAFADIDLRQAMDILNDAQKAFMTLSGKVRAEFDNDPLSFVAFAEDPANLEKLREWGLAKPAEPPKAPIRVEVANPPPAPGADGKTS